MARNRTKPATPTPGHALEHPRVAAVLAIAGFLIGGLAMMAFPRPIVFYVGLGISVISILGVLWLYWRHFRAAFSRSAARTGDRLPTQELAIPVILLVLGIPLTALFYFMQPDWGAPMARMALDKIVVSKSSDGMPESLSVHLFNAGTIAARGQTYAFSAAISDGAIDANTEDHYFLRLESGTLKQLWQTRAPSNEIQPGTQRYYGVKLPPMSKDTLTAILDGRKSLYFFFVFAYDDEYVPENRYRVSEICVYFMWQFDTWKGCHGHNGRIFLSD